MACEDCKCAIDLLGQNQARERVSQGHRPEGEQESGSLAGCVTPSVGWPDGKDDLLRAAVATSSEPFGECLGGERTTAAVEQNGHCRCAALLTINPGEEGSFIPETLALALGMGGGPFQVHGGECVKRILGRRTGADMSQDDVHGEEDIALMRMHTRRPILVWRNHDL